jgi:hypothetical protein
MTSRRPDGRHGHDTNGVRHVTIPDPDGNAIVFAEPPDAAGAA